MSTVARYINMVIYPREGVKMSATIDDVAKTAGVSIKTVSRVVNREKNVSPKTQEKVEAVIAELNYRPNRSARGLAGNRSYLIGLVYDNPSDNFVMRAQAGVLQECQPHHYGLALHPCDSSSPDLSDNVLEWVKYTNVDGLILTPPVCDKADLIRALQDENVPYVVVSSVSLGDAPYVMIDETAAAREMTEHLISIGHTRIAFIKGHPDHQASALRYKGFMQAMQNADISIEPALVLQGYFDFASGGRIAHQMLSLKNPPSAIFASNDDMAAGAVHVAHDMGLVIPKDIAIAGFDDANLSHQIWPSLSTVRQPVRSMSKSGTRYLLDMLSNKVAKNERIQIQPELNYVLKFRASTTGEAEKS